MEYVTAAWEWGHDFKWNDQLYAADGSYPVAGAVAYIAILAVIKNTVTTPVRSWYFEVVHNALLTLLSFGMLMGAIYGAFVRATDEGIKSLVCTQRSPETMWDGPIGATTYIFYLSKYYEFVDTFLLALRQKPTIFLHCWHHGVMPFTCWTWLHHSFFEGAWWCVLVNSFIHTMMYSYYLATVFNIKVPYKKYLTSAQIVQFMSGTAMCLTWYYLKQTGHGCTSSMFPFIWSNVVNFSFLGLFIKFYFDNYNKKKRGQTAKEKMK